jgi:hypothetical protein
MKKQRLLVAASALVVGLSFGSFAYAHDGNGNGNGDGNGNGGTQQPFLNAASAVGASFQDGNVGWGFSKGVNGNNNASNVNGTGLVNLQQNTGNNSLVQDNNTLGAILNCSCTTSGTGLINASAALALSAQVADVDGGVSIGGENEGSSSGEKGGGHHSYWGSGGGHSEWSSHYENAVAGGGNTLTNFGGTGMYNVSQNTGNNSLLQSSNTVAAIIGK